MTLRVAAMLCTFSAALLEAQDESVARIKSPAQRLSELEERVRDLEDELKSLEAQKAQAAAAAEDAAPFYADGVFTMGGVELRLGGQAEFLFVDTENYSNPVVGDTDEKDPYFEVNRLRIEPRLKFNRHITARGQIDFSPNGGDTRLKEFTVRHRAEPVWWFRSTFRLGLDDRVIRQQRRTKTYPMVGNTFWRGETLGAVWSLRFGKRRGRPEDESSAEDAAWARDADEEALDHLSSDNRGELYEVPVDPFDFSSNWGAVTVHLSGGQGPVLADKQIGRDNASFNDIVQDHRNIDDDQQISEVGVALEYERDFGWLGEVGVMGFFYHNRLGDTSVEFLQEDLTVRDNAGNAIAGYGDSNRKESWRYGVGGEYFFPASTLFGEEFTRRSDGLYLQGQWIHGEDGDNFEREVWYAQASYRYSFPDRLIAGRYLRSVEPLVRYGEFDTNLGPDILLPGTWDRERLVVGLNVEVTNEILLRGVYAFNSEHTGGSPGSVGNNELVIELRLQF